MLPEISRRCGGCGAAVRAGARFCPQCGRAVDVSGKLDGEGDVSAAVRQTNDAERNGAAETIGLEQEWDRWRESLSRRVEMEARDDAPSNERKSETRVSASAAQPQSPLQPARIEGVANRQADAALSAEGEPKGRRAAAVREAVRPRVEKVREASMGVLEGAAEDSGLRFVLIAVGLFLLFLFFLLLSQWFK